MQSAAPLTRLVLIRHGETDWNRSRRIQGQLDIPLNAVGQAQAESLTQAFNAAQSADTNPVAVYASPLERAITTAQPLAQQLMLPVTPYQSLSERHFGEFQGLHAADIAARFPQHLERWRSRDLDFVPAGGESLRIFAARVSACLAELAARHPGEQILCFTHGGVLDMAYRFATGTALTQLRDWDIPNAGINQFLYRDEQLVLESWAQVLHLHENTAQQQVEF